MTTAATIERAILRDRQQRPARAPGARPAARLPRAATRP